MIYSTSGNPSSICKRPQIILSALALMSAGIAPGHCFGHDLASSPELPSSEMTTENVNLQYVTMPPPKKKNQLSTQAQGTSQTVTLYQNGSNNDANIAQEGYGNSAFASQDGAKNIIDLKQYGYGNDTLIAQNGYANSAQVTQKANFTSAQVLQDGSFNTTSVTQYAGAPPLKVTQYNSVGAYAKVIQY
ncbi:hypothetical protein LSG25_01755 [Paralcaligenes sp. KSB-10]|jgi:hypothetical protein|uniref:hypothetical protein n=1 Tax=Paralcaligenes sp. KSB-10 TaxID=2901142 RepID=UPI001E5BC31A|nr:hypothetical protein [Paralcaligenes sp. KSB-10]UHL64658.1 hypothetical protein LSG25_01755 [Paralcaligenes sp. KSB-10]